MTRTVMVKPRTGSLADIKRANTPRVFRTGPGSATKKSKAGHLKRRLDNQAENAALALLTMKARMQAALARADAAGAFPLAPDALAAARASTGRIRKSRRGRTVLPRSHQRQKTVRLSPIAEGGRGRRGRRGRRSRRRKS